MSKFTIVVHEIYLDAEGVTKSTQEVFKQSVDTIDLKKVFAAVNSRPRKPRVAKAKTV